MAIPYTEYTALDRLSICGSAVLMISSQLSKHEKKWASNPSSWASLLPVLEAKSPYEALMKMSFSPASDVFTSMMFLAGSLARFQPNEPDMPAHMKNLLFMIDNDTELDDAFKNSRVMKMLLTASTTYHSAAYDLAYRSKKVLAHVFNKFPDFFKLGILRTKSGRMKFKPEDVQKWLEAKP